MSLITSGDTGGEWTEVSTSGIDLTSNINSVNFDGIAPGNYTFEYTLNAAAPCIDPVYTVTVLVEDCACPSAATLVLPELCNDNAVLNLDDYKDTQENGVWSITQQPAGGTATINLVNFDGTGSAEGDYELTFTLSTPPPPGCPQSSSQILTLHAPPISGTALAPVTVCDTSSTAIDLFSLLSNYDNGGTWDIGSNFFTPSGNTPQDYQFTYTVNDPAGVCTDVSTMVTITVEKCDCPNVTTLPPDEICADGGSVDLDEFGGCEY